MGDFWLVQRMKRGLGHDGPITKPEHLVADYMGSAEFEFGAIPKAYKAMREQKLELTTVTIKAFNIEVTFYVVAPGDHADSLQQRFQAWFDDGLWGQEKTYLEHVITRRGWLGESISSEDFARLPIAWWALRENIFFSTDESVAKMWLDAMSTSAASLPQKKPTWVLLSGNTSDTLSNGSQSTRKVRFAGCFCFYTLMHQVRTNSNSAHFYRKHLSGFFVLTKVRRRQANYLAYVWIRTAELYFISFPARNGRGASIVLMNVVD